MSLNPISFTECQKPEWCCWHRMSFTKSTDPAWKYRVFYKASTNSADVAKVLCLKQRIHKITLLSTKRQQAQRAFNKESINAVGVVDIACLLESQQSQRTTWKSRVFYKWTLVHNRIECHQNDVSCEGSTNSISIVNIACLLRTPQSQRTTGNLVSSTGHPESYWMSSEWCLLRRVKKKSISGVNIACLLRSPQSQRTTENLVSSAEHPQLNVIIMMSSTKGPQTQLVSSTLHVLYEVHISNARRGSLVSCTQRPQS